MLPRARVVSAQQQEQVFSVPPVLLRASSASRRRARSALRGELALDQLGQPDAAVLVQPSDVPQFLVRLALAVQRGHPDSTILWDVPMRAPHKAVFFPQPTRLVSWHTARPSQIGMPSVPSYPHTWVRAFDPFPRRSRGSIRRFESPAKPLAEGGRKMINNRVR